MGVVGCIVPWNYPLLLLAWKLAPALAAGNTTVCKPSELTPLSTLMLAPCFDHLPAGVVNLLAGAGDVGEAIVRDERVDCIAFTGSVETGKRVAGLRAPSASRASTSRWAARTRSSCAPTSPSRSRWRRKGGAWAAYLNAGQVCTSAERFYVMRRRLRRLRARVRRLHRDAGAGRSARPAHRHRPDGLRRAARQGGRPGRARGRRGRRRCVTGGDGGGQARGHFFSPAVVTGAPAETELLREETFGPVAPIVPVSSLDEAIELANSTRYGLGCNVYTRDLQHDRALHARDQGRHGVVQRPADRQRRGPVRRHEAVRARARARARRDSRPSRRPSTSTSRPRSRRRSGGTPTGVEAQGTKRPWSMKSVASPDPATPLVPPS